MVAVGGTQHCKGQRGVHFPVLMNPTHEVKVMSGCRTGQRGGLPVLGVEEEDKLPKILLSNLILTLAIQRI